MDRSQLRAVAEQLAHPSGDLGTDISCKMNETNAFITTRSIEALSPKPGEYIVELGPGNGALSCGLVQTFGEEGRYLGIEVAKDMVPLAEKMLSNAGKAEVRLHAGDCHDATVEPGRIE